jgi:hypothetical protein
MKSFWDITQQFELVELVIVTTRSPKLFKVDSMLIDLCKSMYILYYTYPLPCTRGSKPWNFTAKKAFKRRRRRRKSSSNSTKKFILSYLHGPKSSALPRFVRLIELSRPEPPTWVRSCRKRLIFFNRINID